MPGEGYRWTQLVASFKAECSRDNLPCWICGKAINYQLRGRIPAAFSADHITPTSLKGDPLRRANLKPSHYGCNSRRGNTTRGLFPTSRQW